MCGIAMIVDPSRSTEEATIGDMVRRLAHRGPDAQGVHSVGACSMGHARLKILDLSTGDQPMTEATGRYWAVFNGEIYNYVEIRAELERRGRRFLTCSDTEVVTNAYAEWGALCLDRFRGMWAFAIWDAREECLFAARDIFGEKPLYYTHMDGGGIALASEIKAFYELPSYTLSVDGTAVDAYLTLGYVPPDRTIYSEVSTLMAAHCMTWQRGKASIKRYWQPSMQTRSITPETAAEELRMLLTRAVRRQLVADIDVGALLSGGLDSSTIVAIASKSGRRRPLKTFSVGFGDRINELPYARAVAKQYGTEHHELDLGEPDVAGVLEKIVRVYDEPFGDPSSIPTYLIAQYAATSVRVLLSGDGADELFGGYARYQSLMAVDRVRAPRLQAMALRTVRRAFDSPRLVARGHRVESALRTPDAWVRCIRMQTVFNAKEREELWGANRPSTSFDAESFRPPDDIQGVNRGFFFDIASWLPGDILVKVDRAAMAHGVETRPPFLDRDVAEFALSLPPECKVGREGTKIAVHHAFRDLWPPEVRRRTKQGFEPPLAHWLGLPAMRPVIERVFSSGSELCRILPSVMARKRDLDHRMWVVLNLGLWLESRCDAMVR